VSRPRPTLAGAEEITLVLSEYAKCGNCLRTNEHHPSDPFEVVNLATHTRHIGADFGQTVTLLSDALGVKEGK
jgi:hypothetical protein